MNAISLVFALVANFALLFNMARRLRFAIAQPVTIAGWFISSFLLIGLVVAANVAPSFQLGPGQNPALTQAYYYAVMAAVLYFVIAVLMCFTVYGALRGHYPMAFKLTLSQRTLMVQTISYLVYLLAGGAVFAHIEDWLFLNGVYWANTTLLTIGTGDFSPKTHLGQGLLFPYAIGGIVFLGLVIGSIRSLVLERGKKKLGVRLIEKKREKVIKQLDGNNGNVKVNPFTASRNLAAEGKPEIERRRQEFEVMRMIQEHARVKRRWMSLVISMFAWFILWFIGAVVFWVAEDPQQGLTYFESLYFSYVSLLTIGYGDYAPVANSSKAFFVLWSLLAIPTLTILISNMGDTVVKIVKDSTIWISEFSILPGETSGKARLRKAATKTPFAKRIEDAPGPTEDAPGGAEMSEENRRLGASKGAKKLGPLQKVGERLGADLQEEELEDLEEARAHGDKIGEDKHLYHFLLVKELRRVMKDVDTTPDKKYSYREWAWFLRLLGEDESDTKHHRQLPLDPKTGDSDGRAPLGQADANPATGQHGVKWSWIGERSPLMGDQDEPEWLLERLSRKLETLLHKEHQAGRAARGDKAAHDKPSALLEPQDQGAGDALKNMDPPSHTSGDDEKTLGR